MDLTKDIENIVWLRNDIHTISDAKRFSLVPKKARLVVHMFKEAAMSEAHELYHNVPLQQLDSKVQYLFAWFAYCVSKFLTTFLGSGGSRRFLVRVGEDVEEREHTGPECGVFAIKIAIQGKSRSASPRKGRIRRALMLMP